MTDPEEAKRVKAAALRKLQEETLVALFDRGGNQVTDWAPFADGHSAVSDAWMKSRRRPLNDMTGLHMRTRDGKNVSDVEPHVQEHVVKTYSMTWRTVW